jgi:hypothetical protein
MGLFPFYLRYRTVIKLKGRLWMLRNDGRFRTQGRRRSKERGRTGHGHGTKSTLYYILKFQARLLKHKYYIRW